MRQVKLTLILVVLSITANAQIYLSEDFQQGIPNTWTIIDNDGFTPDNTVSFVDESWIAYEENEDELDTVALSTSNYQPAGTADDWLISPAIKIDSNSFLTWKARALDSLIRDGYEVRISTNPTILGFLGNIALLTISEENFDWTKRSVDLRAMGYTNDSVYIAFRNNSSDKYLLAIDDIVVWDCTFFEADAGTIDSSQTISCSGSSALNLGLSPSFVDISGGNVVNGTTNEIANWDPLPGRPFEDGDCCASPGASPPYSVFSFQVTVTGAYDIHQEQIGYDGIMYIYTDPFSLIQNPPVTFIAANDDSADITVGVSYIEALMLTQGVTYYLVSTGFSDAESGNFITSFTGPGDLLIETTTLEDLPYDYGFLIIDSVDIIVATGDDLSEEVTFPGSAAGDDFQVVGIAYVEAGLDLASFIGQPLSNLIDLADSSKCVAITEDPHEVTVLESLTVNAGEPDTICPGQTVNLMASGTGTSYIWSTGDSSANSSAQPQATQSYSVTATSGSGCSATDDVKILVFTSDGGLLDPGPLYVCEGDTALNLDLEPEFTASFVQSPTNEINGNTAVNFTWSPLSGRPRADGTCCSGFNTVYDLVRFQVTATGVYEINQFQDNYDGYLLLYTDPFDITQNPPITFVAGNDDSAGVAGISHIDSAFLSVGQTYYLISTGFSLLDFGDYQTTISGPGNLLIIGPPDSSFFAYEFVIVNNAGDIMTIGQNLFDSNNYPGAAGGTEYAVCGVSYVRDSINLNAFVGGPYSALQNVSCLSLTDTCLNVKIFTEPIADAGTNDTLCVSDSVSLSANAPAFGTGIWSLVSGSGNITNDTLANTSVKNLGIGNNRFSWTVDNGGCQKADTVNIFVNPSPQVDAGDNDTICSGEQTILTATGGSNYLWNTGDMTATISQMPATNTIYSVTATDTNGCQGTDSVMVLVRPSPNVNLSDAAICPGSTTTLNAAYPGATYVWFPGGATTPTLTVDSAGVYFVSVTRGGCTTSDTAEVTLSSSLNVNLSDHIICAGDSLILDAGNPGATYLWSTTDTSQTILVNMPGEYSVTVSDTSCTGSDTSLVSLPVPMVDAGANDTVCLGDSVTLTATGNGTFEWSTGQTGNSIMTGPTQNESFTVTLTDSSGCQSLDTVLVVVNSLPNADAGENDTICAGSSTTLTASGGVSYQWNDGPTGAIRTVMPSSTQTYTVAVTDSNGCSATDSVTVVVQQQMGVNVIDTTACTGDSIELVATAGVSYLWSTGSSNQVITVSPANDSTYTVMIASSNGCMTTDSFIVTVNPLPTADAGANRVICEGESVQITATGGTSYSWDNGDMTATITVNPTMNTTYEVTVTDSNSCKDSDQVTVSVQAAPSVSLGAIDSVYCTTAGVVTLMGSPSGGTFSGTGVFGSTFDPATADTIGTNAIVYTYQDTVTGCTGSDTIYTTVEMCIGIDFSGYGKINVFPNPTEDDLTISLSDMVSNNPVIIKIYDALGRLNLETEIRLTDNSKQTIEIQELSVGTYWLTIIQDNKAIFSTPVFKNKR